jgi:hypothetical protein
VKLVKQSERTLADLAMALGIARLARSEAFDTRNRGRTTEAQSR